MPSPASGPRPVSDPGDTQAYIVNLPAGDQFKPGYVAINPKSTIPTLVRGDGSSLTEVPAIAYWLGRSHPRAALWPDDIETSCRLIETMVYIAGTIHGQGFARIFATHTFARNSLDHASVRELGRDIVAKGFAVISAALGEKIYLADAYSVADPLLFYVEFWADKTGMTLPANLAAHYGGCWRARRFTGCCVKRVTTPPPSAGSRTARARILQRHSVDMAARKNHG
jgi:glutathione S-transferase